MIGAVNFLNNWGDKPSLDKLKASDKSSEVHKAEAINHLKGMAMRFERSPNESTIRLWASDMIDAGYKEHQIAQVCKSAPYKFEKHPTLSQLMELLRPYLAKEAVSYDELNDLTNRCHEHLKAKFIALTDKDTYSKMVDFYVKHEPELLKFNRYYHEVCMLNDWCRTYLKDGTAIMIQREETVTRCHNLDREYLTKHLKAYARENKL